MSKLITKAEFDKMRDAYAAKHPKATQSVAFDATDVLALLGDHPQGTKLKAWLGKTDLGQTTIMLTPVTSDGIMIATMATADGNPPILDRGQICPPYCS
jgi:hypothetical protein